MPTRRSVDLSGFPDLVVIYLGYRAASLRGVWSAFRIGTRLREMQRSPPDGLLAHETLMFGLLHPGFRQYWRDLESLEAFTRTRPHSAWWGKFGRDAGGGGFWHETYRLRGGMEAVYLDMPPTGLATFAPERGPDGPFRSARQRMDAASAIADRQAGVAGST